jgi:hypothetical protein
VLCCKPASVFGDFHDSTPDTTPALVPTAARHPFSISVLKDDVA